MFMSLTTLVYSGILAACPAVPRAVRTLIQVPLHVTTVAGVTDGVALAALIITIIQLNRNSRSKEELDTNTRSL